jgi:uncharacterized repeat protein (TIGR02543 family)
MKIMPYSYKLLFCVSLLLTTNSVKAIEGFSLIPQGAFTMGNSVAADTDLSDAPTRTVTLDAFYMGKYEVTKAEWDEVRTWGLSNGYTDLAAGSGKASNHPVQTITWYDMVKWCNARSQKEGLTPAYYTNDAQTTIYKTGDVDVTNAQVNWSANGYRLPTEAEWEKAARGGLSGKRFPWGDTISHSQANYQASSNFSYDFSGSVNNYHPTYATEPSPYTSPVGAFAANGYGLHDMAGNVWEWCWDWYGTYAAGSQTNPRGSTSGTTRVGRGGGWHYGPLICRVAWRYGFDSIPTYSNMDFGFRVARSAVDADSDSDGLTDSVETNTGVFVSESNTGTNPNNADTDADGVPDGLEVKEKTSPVDATKFNSFSKGLVAYYPFNGNANDCSGNQRHGIVLGNVQLAADSNAIPNSCYEFDGNDYGTEGKLATIEVESPFLNTWEDFTISGMYCASDLSKERQVVVNSIPHVNISVAYNYMSSNTTFGIGSSEGWIGTNYEGNDGPPTEQQWRQFILRKSGTNYKLFINGALVRDENIPQSINFTETVGLRFGSISSNYNTDPFYSHVFSGKLDEFRVYQRALSDAEISGLYMKQAARFKIIEGSFTWHEAKADAEARGGRLAVLDTQEKIDDANAFLKSHDYWPDVWIGLTDEEQEGYWKWIDDSPLASSNWLQGEPNDMYGEDFALLYRNVPGVHSNGEWNDVGESFRTAYLLEHSQVEIFDTDGDGYADAEEIQWGSNPNDSASYPQVYLSIMGSGGGYIEGSGISMDDPWSGESYSGYVPLRSTVTLTAFAYYNHWFSHWYGDVGDAPYDTTLVLHMDSNKWVGANFQYNGGYWPPYDYDSDGDGIYDDNEYYYGTDPYNYDSDYDGLGDGDEVYYYGTSPTNSDSDYDELSDGDEIYAHYTSPTNSDTDGDGYDDGEELSWGTDPRDGGSFPHVYLNLDSNYGGYIEVSYNGYYNWHNGYSSIHVPLRSTVTLTAYADDFYWFSGWGGDASGTDNPLTITIDGDKWVYANFEYDGWPWPPWPPQDSDGDGLSDSDEYYYGTDPYNYDSDYDGLGDGDEVYYYGTNPANSDSDYDELSDGDEIYAYNTSPTNNDTDGDGYDDGYEVRNSSNPLDPSAVPTYQLTLVGAGVVEGGAFGYSGSLARGTIATLTATPNTGYIFSGWTGDATGTDNPFSLTMDADKVIGAIFTQDLGDSDGDGLSNYRETVVYGTDPAKSDSDDDGLSDAWELGVGRFSLITAATPLTWQQARDDARSKGGDLACFPTEDMWTTVRTNLGEVALDAYLGAWIGASDAEVEGIWKWVNGLPFTFANWGTSRPSATVGNGLDFLEISGGDGAEIWKWYDRAASSTRFCYILETGYSTNPLVADADGDGLNDGQEQTANTHPFLSDTDGDGLKDSDEINITQTNPLSVDSDGDTVSDANEDPDADSLSNLLEVNTHGTNPLVADTDGDSYSDAYELSNSSNPLDGGSLPTYQLTLSNGGIVTGGSFEYTGNLAHGTNATLTATPATGYVFSGWIGDASGTNNPLTLLMNADKTVEATFVSDASDFDGDGLTNYQEIVEHNTNPNMADTNSDGLRDGLAAALGMNPNADHSLFVETILAERAQLGLRKDNDIIDMRPGSMLLQRAPGSDKLEIRMKMQKSSNMLNWQDDGEAVIEVPVDPTSPRQFYRFGVK